MTIEIAGNKTTKDWQALKPLLLAAPLNNEAWAQATQFFDLRMEYRYFNPIEAIRSHISANMLKGEGFAICTLLCSLIEAIETFYQGKNFSQTPENDFEYKSGESRSLYRNFLTERTPFNEYFDIKLANDFYSNVRCALLHEASTRNGWKINIREQKTISTIGEAKVINRSLFVSDLKKCIVEYKKTLLIDSNLREAFIRKFDGICKNSV